MTLRFTAYLPASLLLAASVAPLSADDKITYNDNVLPIFRNACLNCHNPDKKKAGLDLSTYQGALQGSENGKVLDSGNPSGSLLFKCIKGIEEPKMPPKGDKVSDGDLALIEKWIAGQLLETATGKAVAASKNNVQAAVVSLTRPDGPPPMPGELPLEPVVRTRAANALTALAVSPWAPLVAIGGQKQIVLYNVETLEPLGVLPFPEGFPAIIKFSRNGQLLLTGGGLGGKSGKVALWDIKTGDRIGTVGNEFDQVLAADLSADQQFVALGGPNKLVKIYATKDGKLVTSIKKHTDWVTAIAYSPEGKFLATADRNGGIQVWEGSTGKEFNILPGHKVMVTGLAFMTGVLASSSEDGKISLWDVKEGKEIRSWNAHAGGAAWVDFTPDGRLVSCGRDKIAKVWDQSGKELGKSQPFADIALRAALSNDRIIAGDWTGAIRVCAFDGKPLGELTANPPTLADRIVLAEKRAADAQAALPGLQQQFAALDQKLTAEKSAQEATKVAAAPPAEELNKKLEQQNAEVAKLREIRATKADGTPEWTEANNQVQAKKAEIADTQAKLATAAATPAASVPAKPSPTEEELAKVKAALDQANTQITSARAELDHWKLARIFQAAHNAKQVLTEKQAQYDGFVQAAKEALAPVDKVQADVATAEKAVAEAPGKLKEMEMKLADARAAVEPLNKSLGGTQAAVADMEKAFTAMTEAAKTGASNVAELSKKLEALTAEIAKRREFRATKQAATPEYAEADAKVQAIKPEIAQTETALAAAKTQAPAADNPEIKAAQAELTKLREALEKVRGEAKAATDLAGAAEQAYAAAQKSLDQTAKQLGELRAKAPEITKTAQSAKLEAERAAAAAEKELAAAKSEAEQRRAAYEAAKTGGIKSAALAIPQTKS
jgi:WD40 repeat protein